MKYPGIEFCKDSYSLIGFEVPENYEELVKSIDENFKTHIKNLAKRVLEEFEVGNMLLNLQFDDDRGLHGIHIGNGRGAYLSENRYIFKNIDESYQALAVFNILSAYLNRLQEYRE